MIRICHDGVAGEGLVADDSIDAWLELGWKVVVEDLEPETVWTPITAPSDTAVDSPVPPVTPSTPTPPKPAKGTKES